MGERVVVEAHLAASTERAFAAFTSADELARWWWPHIPDTTYAFDPRPGGGYAIRSAAAGIGVAGEVVSLDPPNALELTWRWLSDGVPEPEEAVRITFEPDGDGTLVTVDHLLDDASDAGDGIREGWESVLGRLRVRLSVP
jgi:uncharacterized protein YndB with AHSA1/START domain